MAGDWIKFEHTTPDKPEVVKMAATLNINQDSVVGKLLRIWIWADLNSVSGEVVGVTEAFIDRLVCKRGFASAMRAANWLSGEDGSLRFSNFGRHNGSTAKGRAETNRRVKNHRERNSDSVTDALQKPLPEKRREEKRKTVGQSAAVAAPANDSEWLETLRTNPAYTGINLETEYAKMVAWCSANRKQPTRRRFINWLNRCERPMNPTAARPIRPTATEPTNWKAFLNHEFPDSRFSAGQQDEAHKWTDLDGQTQQWLVGEMSRRRSA